MVALHTTHVHTKDITCGRGTQVDIASFLRGHKLTLLDLTEFLSPPLDAVMNNINYVVACLSNSQQNLLYTQCLSHIQCVWCSGHVSRGSLNQNPAGNTVKQSHETWFPRGLLVSLRAHTDPRDAIFFPFPGKATVGEVK